MKALKAHTSLKVGMLWCVLVIACTPTGDNDGLGSPVPMLRGRVTLEIGTVDGEDETIFGSIGGVVGDSGGGIFVADFQADDVRAFGPDGEYLYTVATRGQGPGEVYSPCCLAVSPSGELWVRDTGNARYSAFRVGTETSRFITSVPMNHGAANRWAPTSFAGDTLIDVGGGPGPDGGTMTQRFFIVDGTAVASEAISEPRLTDLGGIEVAVERRGFRMMLYSAPPFGPKYILAHGVGGLWADVVTDAYEVTIHQRDGGVLTISQQVALGPTLSDREQELASREIEADRRRAAGRPELIPWDVPDRKQPLEDLYFDADGRLWVEIATRDGESRTADIYSKNGDLLEKRTWPGGVQLGLIGWPGGSWSLGVTRDSLGVERVVKVEWAESQGTTLGIP